MKFTNGFWLMKRNIDPIFAVEYQDHKYADGKLTVYMATNHIADRGNILNRPMLTAVFTAPAPNIIRVELIHFAGAYERGPAFELNEEPDKGGFVRFEETADTLTFTSGETSAVIDRRPENWSVRFERGGRLLTETSYRNMACMQDRDTGKSYMVEQLLLDVGECVYGFGERYTSFVKNGQEIDIWNEDGGTASQQTYKNIPFYLSSRGYGVFVDDPRDIHFEVGSEKVERIQFSIEAQKMAYCVIGGADAKDTLRIYTGLTGRPALPPAWSFGLWLTTSFTTSYDEETVTGFIQGMADRNIPLHTFHFDAFWMKGYEWCNFEWDKETFPEPRQMLKRLKERGLHICVWFNPYIAQKSKLFDEGLEHGYFVKKTDGSVWQTDLWQAGMALVDFTNPEAKKWYLDCLRRLLDDGVDCFKTDFGERIPVKDIVWYDGSDPVKMHNYYTYLYNEAVFGLLEEYRGKNEAALFARSATVGGQKFPIHWGGDCSATYGSMAESLRGGLSLSLCGFGFWSHDISGFEQTAPADIYKRWCQFGLFSSHSRLHGSTSYRVPWLFDEEACDVLRELVNLKCRLMPYLYEQAVIAHEEGIPMMRAMFLEFPDDPTCLYLDRQYMLGDSILVAPVFSDTGEVTFYVPDGNWTDLFTGEAVEGGRWYRKTYDYFHFPVLVRENSVIVFGNNDQRPDYDYAKGAEIRVYQPQEGMEKEIFIPSPDGEKKLPVKVSCKNGEVTVQAPDDPQIRMSVIR